ncbi:hypothetical protein [Paraburkholderia hospita]|uniref:hypothetical protein n=1 Tax=Paraburkholderia hospita TaxID=169430 RepID=UPI000B347309|nr:hypothetical protein [Paraburkholderia hospita]OUL80412.1 hypothetical protein CA603_31645 [Paraburkholderia hospita]
MFEKFKGLSPAGRRAVIAVALFAIMFVDVLLPKCDFTVALFLVSGLGGIWAIGLMRPILLFLFFLMRAVLRYKAID